MKTNLADLRKEYALATLTEEDVAKNPFQQFEHWFQQILDIEVDDANAMTLCTVDESGQPQGRIVLLKGLEEGKFVFFTNYKSHKGSEIEAHPAVSLVFYWKELQRQVRIQGSIQKISAQASADYFHSRPVESQLGAWASHQSQPLASREELQARFEELQRTYTGKEVPCPEHWGGYAVEAQKIEFWQGRESRMHDRIVYTRLANNDWQIQRLNP
ncbi:MAG TPA: pyridoxamine 5'-phosphate oxidase [Chitinophagaceae bacterium]|nr:pyridoxamine 5'-phosphate oxidase [Chitinophagaceae bacterium]